MGLGLLVPLFLAGLAGVLIPILVHLTRRKRRNVVRFPSLMFLRRIPFREQRRRRIRHWLLLLLRAAALAAVAAAFARPFFEDSEAGISAGAGPRELVVLLDRSYSMEANGAFEEAVEEARRIFDGMGPLDRASLVTFDRSPQVVVRSSLDPAELGRALDTVAVGSGATRYGPALGAAATVVEESGLPEGEIFLVSDFQLAGWRDDDERPLTPKARLVARRVGRVEAASDWIGRRAPSDLAVAGVSLARSASGGRERVTASARLANLGADEPQEAHLVLSVDGDEVERIRTSVSASDAATATFRPFTLSSPFTRGTVSLAERDALAANDHRRFVVSPGNRIGVLVAEGRGAEGQASFYLRRALEISSDARFDLRFRRTRSVGATDLDGIHVAILNDLHPDDASLARLGRFVRDGGGVIVALGPGASWERQGSRWESLPAVIGTVRDHGSGAGGRLGLLKYSHPALEPFAGPRSGDFTGTRFHRSRELAPLDSAEVLMHFDDGVPALVEQEFGRGRVLVWSSSLDAYWNDLALQPVYLPFVHGLVEHASGRTETVVEFAAGQLLDLGDPVALESAGAPPESALALAGRRDLIAISPTGAVLPVPDPGEARFVALDEAGFYAFRERGAEPGRHFSVAVNVDVTEGDLTAIDPQELLARLTGSTEGRSPVAALADGADERTSGSSAGVSELRRADQERRQSLWRWLLFAALALLAAETVLSNRMVAVTGGRRGRKLR